MSPHSHHNQHKRHGHHHGPTQPHEDEHKLTKTKYYGQIALVIAIILGMTVLAYLVV